jgi:hypothetical protein
MKYLALPIIWFLFYLAGIVAPFTALLRALLTFSPKPISDTFHAENRVAATVVGFNGEETISSACGKSTCRWCRYLCALLSWALDDNRHCEREADR